MLFQFTRLVPLTVFIFVMAYVDAFSIDRISSSLFKMPFDDVKQLNSSPTNLFLASLMSLSIVFPSHAIDIQTENSGDWQRGLQSSLQAPTTDQPQIPLPYPSSNMGNKPNIPPSSQVQALVSFQNPKIERPPITDSVLILQVFDKRPAEGGVSMGGAKIPVSKVRFPVSVSLGLKNAKVQEQWERVSSKQDLWVQAMICDQASKLPCSSNQQLYRGEGLSKLLNELPGYSSTNGETMQPFIRVPASLILEKNKNASQ